jgi:hypothetical protein
MNMSTVISGKIIITITLLGTDADTAFGLLGEIDFEDRLSEEISDLADTIDNEYLAETYGAKIEVEDLLAHETVIDEEEEDEEE